MKCHLNGAIKIGKLEFSFKTFEVKLKAGKDVLMFQVRPKKLGFVFARSTTALHFAISFVVLHMAITYHKA